MADQADILTLTAEIVASYVGANSHVQADEIPDVIRQVRAALSEADAPEVEPEAETPKASAAQVRKSITPEGLISFIDGKPYKTLKRHLARYGMTIDDYRRRFGLPASYPSVAPDYSAARSEMARKLGLGARGRGRSAEPAEAEASAAEPGSTETAGKSARGSRKAASPAA